MSVYSRTSQVKGEARFGLIPSNLDLVSRARVSHLNSPSEGLITHFNTRPLVLANRYSVSEAVLQKQAQKINPVTSRKIPLGISPRHLGLRTVNSCHSESTAIRRYRQSGTQCQGRESLHYSESLEDDPKIIRRFSCMAFS